jgi:hypothetical protein
MAELDLPQHQKVERAEHATDRQDNAMALCNRMHDEIGWGCPRKMNQENSRVWSGGDEKNNDESSKSMSARLDQTSTGDTVVHADGKIGISMPSGEYLQLNGTKDWVLKDANGNEIATNRTSNGDLPDGAALDHVVPIMGKGWTVLRYPNGDTVCIDKNGVNIERDGNRVKVPFEPIAPADKFN